MTDYLKLASELPASEPQPSAAPVLYSVADTNPDAEAGLRTLSRSTGIPVEALREKSVADEARRADTANRYDSILRDSPKTAGFLQNPVAAAVAHDDVEGMSFIERTISGMGGIIEARRLAFIKRHSNLPGAPVDYNDKLFAGGIEPLVTERDFKERADKMFASGLFPTKEEAAAAVRRQIAGFVKPGTAAMSPGRAESANVANASVWLDNTLPFYVSSAWRGIKQNVADVVGLDQAAAEVGRQNAIASAQRDLSRPDFGSDTANMAASGAESLIQQTPALVAGVASGGVAPTLAYLGAMTYGQNYSKYRGRGASTGMAMLGAGGEAAVEVLTEKLPMGETLRALESATGGRWKQAANSYMRSQLQEQQGEQVATLLQDAIDTAIANPGKTWSDYLAERPDAAYQTMVATLTQSALMAGVGGVARIAGRAGYEPPEQKQLQSEASAQFIEQLNKGAAASKVLARDPDTFQDFVKAAAADGPVTDVYIDAETLNQSGLADQVLAASPAAAEQFQEALATGGQVRIPVEEYAARIAPQEYAQQLLDDLRIHPEDMTRREAQDFAQSGAMQELEQTMARIIGDKAQTDTFTASRDAVKQRVLDNLNALGRFTPQKNELDATLIAARSATRAAQLGVTPEQFFNDYLLKVTAEGVGGEVLSQDTANADLYVGHNITAEKLRYALDLGGLPAPSLGVSRTTTGGFDGFGDITLLAPKAILESSGARTFNADVYSPRQPRPVYKPNQKTFDDLVSKLREMPGGFTVADIDEVGRYGAEALARSDAVKLLYLTEIGQAPKLKQQKAPAEIKKAAKTGLKYSYQLREDPTVKALAKKHYELMLQKYADAGLPEADLARGRSRYFEDSGDVAIGALTEFSRKVERYISDGGIDTGELRADIAIKLRTEAQSDAFEKWVKDMAAPMLGEKKLEISPSRRIPYTLDNVTAQMIKDLRGGEGFNYGAGSIRAMFAAEMRSVREIQNRRGEIVSGEDMKKAKEESQKKLTEVLDALKPFYKYDANGWGYMDDATRAIAEGEKGWREAFRVTAESRKIITDYVSYLKNLPTEYFETKMQRAVGLSEFAVAVVPTGTPADVISALEANGLKIKTYNKNKDGSRVRAIAAAGAESGVLFQSEGVNQNADLAEAKRQINEQLAIADRMIAERGGLFAPNGEKSKLSRYQWAQVRTANFKRWFGDWEGDPAKASKVVDDNGEPLVVYHGTQRAPDGITVFGTDSGYAGQKSTGASWFTEDPGEASGYAEWITGQNGVPFGNPSVYPAFINIRMAANNEDIYDAATKTNESRRNEISAQIKAGNYDYEPEGGYVDATPEIALYDARVIKSLNGAGFDGAIFDTMDNGLTNQVVFRPNQIKSAIGNAGTFSGGTDNILYQSASLRSGKETLKKYGLQPGKKYKTREIAAALEARQREKYGKIDRNDYSPEALSKISRWMVEEIKFELENPGKSGVGWYGEKFQRALDAMGDAYPELKTDKTSRNLMTALIAITSDGQKVVPNFTQAMEIYGRFRKGGETEGKFTTARGHQRQESIFGNLEVIQRLYDTKGPDGMHAYLMQERSIADLKKIAKEAGGDLSSDYQVHIKMPMAAIEFGPKLGAFYANLMGAHGYLTMDRWWSRTFNRYRGLLLQSPTQAGLDRFKELMGNPGMSDDEVLSAVVDPRNAYAAKNFKNGTEIEKAANTIYKAAFEELEDAPFGAKDRTFMLDAVNKAQKSLKRSGYNISIADIQAILWYYEKRLYGELGARQTADISYEDAAKRVVSGIAGSNIADPRGSNASAVGGESGMEGQIPGEPQEPGTDTFQEVGGNFLFQPDAFDQIKRGSYSPSSNTIALLKNADLSTFLHESGHYFFETDIAIAGQILRENGAFGIDTMTPGQQQILRDVSALLKWHGIEGDIASQIDQWSRMDFEERRAYHEKTAESFERYLMEGNAPSIELQPMFQAFRQWLLSAYKSLKDFLFRNPDAGELNPEVRAVFDRMLATEEEIKLAEQARGMLPLFADAMNAGMTPAEFAEYQKLGDEATQAAIDQLQAQGVRDMKWLSNARSRMLKQLQRQAKAQRAEMRAMARMDVLSEPVYQAWNILTSKMTAEDKLAGKQKRSESVDPAVDSLFEAIAKLGGLNKEALVVQWGIDPKDKAESGLFGRPVLRAKDAGRSLDAMVEVLTEEGYLTPDENGKGDIAELEDRFKAELRGDRQYSSIRNWEPEQLAGQGQDLSGISAARIDRDSLDMMEDMLQEAIDRLESLGMTARSGGIHPDVLSEILPGWTSGDELVRALADARPMKKEIEARTDQLMLEQYSDLATPEAIQRAADAAVHNDARERFLAAEHKALVKASGDKTQKQLLLSAARDYARQLIGRQRIRDIRPSQYTAAEARAAKAAATSKDMAQKATEKRNQILSSMAAREAYRAQDDVNKALRYLKKFDSPTIRKRVNGDYVDQIEAMLEKVDLRKRSLKDIDRRKSFGTFVRSQIEKGVVPAMSDSLLPPGLRAAYQAKVMERDENGELVVRDDVEQAKVLADYLDMAEARSYKDMTVDEFRGLEETIRQIEHLGRKKKSLLTARDGATYEQKRDELVASVVANSEQLPDRLNRTIPNDRDEKLRGLRDFRISLRKIGMIARLLDGNKDGGPMWDFFVRSANERGDWETQQIANASEVLTKALRPVFTLKGGMRGKGIYFETIGRSLNREQRIGLALNVGNDGNLQRLLDGEGWTYADIQPVLESLTAAEWQAVQDVWDHMDSYRPLIAAIERRTVGGEPEWVQPMRFTVNTKDGQTLTLNGGYYPVKYDIEASQRAEELEDATDAKRAMSAATNSSTTHRSFVKKRAEMVVGRPLELSLSAMYSGVQDVIHDLAWREWLIDASKMISSSTLDDAIRRKYGAETPRAIRQWISDIAAGTRKPRGVFDRAAAFLRRNVAASGLALNVMNAVQNITGLNNSIERIGAKWMAVGQGEYLSGPKEAAQWVQEKSSFMAQRARTQFRDLNELRNIVESGDGLLIKAKNNQFALITITQKMVDTPTWIGAYRKAEAEGAVVQMADGSIDDSKAVAMADQAVIDAQGSGMIKDLSAVERGGELAKLFTAYYSYMNTTYNLAANRIAGARGRSPRERGAAALHLLTLMAVPVALMAILKAGLTPGDDEDWQDPEKLAKKLAMEQASFAMGLVPFAREFTPMIQPFLQDQTFGYQGPAGMRVIGDATKFSQQAAQGEFDDGFRKAAVGLSGSLFGLPAAQINRTWTGVEALADDKTDNPGAVVFGYQGK